MEHLQVYSERLPLPLPEPWGHPLRSCIDGDIGLRAGNDVSEEGAARAESWVRSPALLKLRRCCTGEVLSQMFSHFYRGKPWTEKKKYINKNMFCYNC